MSMLPRLRPRRYYDLVVEVAIVRPGPIQGGMVHPYLKNRLLGDDEIDYPGAAPGAAAHERRADLPGAGDADRDDRRRLHARRGRRCAAPWRPGSARAGSGHSTIAWSAAWSKGYARDYAESIFRQMEGFGEYGFPESHAAGFAQLAYASSWIKCHHPDVFLVALLNSQPLGFYAPAQLVRDARARRRGAPGRRGSERGGVAAGRAGRAGGDYAWCRCVWASIASAAWRSMRRSASSPRAVTAAALRRRRRSRAPRRTRCTGAAVARPGRCPAGPGRASASGRLGGGRRGHARHRDARHAGPRRGVWRSRRPPRWRTCGRLPQRRPAR